jgi:hypothetical protein
MLPSHAKIAMTAEDCVGFAHNSIPRTEARDILFYFGYGAGKLVT